VFSQISLATPMYLLYEISIWIARMIEKKRDAAEAEEEADLMGKKKPAAAGATASVAAAPAEETDFNLTR